MKKTFKKVIAAIIATGTLSFGTTSFISNATTDEYNTLSYETIDSAYTSTFFSFDVYSSSNQGSYVAPSSTVTMSGAICTTGQAIVKFHIMNYNGTVVNSRIIPGPGNNPVTSYLSLTKGATYYITVEPYGCNHAVGSFTLS